MSAREEGEREGGARAGRGELGRGGEAEQAEGEGEEVRRGAAGPQGRAGPGGRGRERTGPRRKRAGEGKEREMVLGWAEKD